MIAPIVNPLSRLVWLKKDLKVWFLRCCLSMRRTIPWVYNQFGLNRPSVSSIRTVLLGLDWVVSEWEHLGSDLAKSHPEGKTAPAGCQAGKHEPNLAKALQFHGILWFASLESKLLRIDLAPLSWWQEELWNVSSLFLCLWAADFRGAVSDD